MEIKDFKIKENSSVFIIAELSANHNQNFDIAVKTIKAAKKSGADAIKLQTYTPETITIKSDKKYFLIKEGLWKGKTLYELYEQAHTPWEWHSKLMKIAEEEELICFSSPFDFSAVDFLQKLNVPAYKIASFEIQDIPLIKYVASMGKPIIISTGIANLADIELAVNTCYEEGNEQIALLKCTSAYPTPFEEANLRTIPHLKDTFKTIVGLSDHTLGYSVPIASVALGAQIIEKHFILDKNFGGPDAKFSLDPHQFKKMVTAIRNTEKSLGKISYKRSEKVVKNKIFARSLFVVKDMKQGEKFTKKNLQSIRPGYGVHPKFYFEILGMRAGIDIEKGTPFTWSLISKINK